MIFGRKQPQVPQVGHDVVTNDDESLGEITAVRDDYLEVFGGTIDRQVTWQVPRSAINKVDGQTVRLSVSRIQATAKGWEHLAGQESTSPSV
jgi:hypothetical protein